LLILNSSSRKTLCFDFWSRELKALVPELNLDRGKGRRREGGNERPVNQEWFGSKPFPQLLAWSGQLSLVEAELDQSLETGELRLDCSLKLVLSVHSLLRWGCTGQQDLMSFCKIAYGCFGKI
jgi:hypothetical protein